MEKLVDGNLGLVRAGPVGFGNNIYIVIDEETQEAAFIDAPDEVEKSVAAAEFAGVTPATILLTHSHPDHTASIAALKERYGCRLIADPAEPWIPEGQLDEVIADGDTVNVGGLAFRVRINSRSHPRQYGLYSRPARVRWRHALSRRTWEFALERSAPAGDRFDYVAALRAR